MKRILSFVLVVLMVCIAVPSYAEGIIPTPPDTVTRGQTAEKTVVDYFASIGIDAAFIEKEGSGYSFDLGNGRGAMVFAYGDGDLEWTPTNPDDALLMQWMDMRFKGVLDVRGNNDVSDWDKQAIEGNTLISFKRYGDQAVRVALAAMERGEHPQMDELRIKLCERILDERLDVPGGYTNAREFLDRMVILEQDALPPVDETLFSDDPIEQTVLRAVMDYNNEMKANWQTNADKWQVICAVYIYETEETADALTVWASVRESQYALFGGKNIKEGSGGIVPTRLTFTKDDAGKWALSEYLEPGDGTDYWPGIQKMCEGHPLLAEKMVDLRWEELNAALEKNLMRYLDQTGLYHPDARLTND